MDSETQQGNKSKNQLSEPEKVLADAALFRCLQKEGLQLSDIAAALPSRKMKLYTTGCTMAELAGNQEKHKIDVSKALHSAMDATDLGCGHGDAGFSSVDCIANFMRDTNSQQFIVATDSEKLQQKLKLLPGIRFIGLEGGVFSLKNSRQESDPSNIRKRLRDISSSVALGSVEKETDIHPSKMPRSNFENESKGPHTIFVVGFGVDAAADLHEVRDILRKHFSSCGQITRIFIPKNESGGLKDNAFIDFTEKNAFNKALKLTRTEINGDVITVEQARPFKGSLDGGNDASSSSSSSSESSFEEEQQSVKFAYVEDREDTFTVFVLGFGSNGDYIQDRAALRAHFSECGYITRIFVPKNQQFGFIDFNDETAFIKALELNRTEVNGETITVEPARRQGGRGYQA